MPADLPTRVLTTPEDRDKFWAFVMEKLNSVRNLDAELAKVEKFKAPLVQLTDQMEASLKQPIQIPRAKWTYGMTPSPDKKKHNDDVMRLQQMSEKADSILSDAQEKLNTSVHPLHSIRTAIAQGNYVHAMSYLRDNAAHFVLDHQANNQLGMAKDIQKKITQLGRQLPDYSFNPMDMHTESHVGKYVSASATEFEGQSMMPNWLNFSLMPPNIREVKALMERVHLTDADRERFNNIAFDLLDGSRKIVQSGASTDQTQSRAAAVHVGVQNAVMPALLKDKTFIKAFDEGLGVYREAVAEGDPKKIAAARDEILTSVANMIGNNVDDLKTVVDRGRPRI